MTNKEQLERVARAMRPCLPGEIVANIESAAEASIDLMEPEFATWEELQQISDKVTEPNDGDSVRIAMQGAINAFVIEITKLGYQITKPPKESE